MTAAASPSAARSPEKLKLYSLQVLRGVAAASVVFSHSIDRLKRTMPDEGTASVFANNWNLVGAGHVGVDVFFVISGFVMMYVHASDFGRPNAWKGFLSRRLIRIVPIYWLLTTLALALLLAAPGLFTYRSVVDPLMVAGSYLFVPVQSADGLNVPLLGVGWTLNFEMFFYLVFAGLLFLPRRAAVIALLAIFSTLALVGVVVSPEAPALAMITSTLLLEFAMGVLIAWIFMIRPGFIRRAAPFAMLAVVPWAAFTVNGNPDEGLERLIFWGFPAAAAVIFCLGLRFEKTGLGRSALVAFGDASYSIYLIQVFALPALSLTLLWAGFRWFDGAVLLVTGGTVVIGMLFWWIVERPLTRGLRGWLKPRLPSSSSARA